MRKWSPLRVVFSVGLMKRLAPTRGQSRSALPARLCSMSIRRALRAPHGPLTIPPHSDFCLNSAVSSCHRSHENMAPLCAALSKSKSSKPMLHIFRVSASAKVVSASFARVFSPLTSPHHNIHRRRNFANLILSLLAAHPRPCMHAGRAAVQHARWRG